MYIDNIEKIYHFLSYFFLFGCLISFCIFGPSILFSLTDCKMQEVLSLRNRKGRFLVNGIALVFDGINHIKVRCKNTVFISTVPVLDKFMSNITQN